MTDARVLAIVPARAGSQGLPGKNLRPLAGRPMTAWTLDAGLGATVIDRLVVSTDDPGVMALAQSMGVEVIARPAVLAGPSASVIDAIDHVLETIGDVWDFVVLLQPTSPLRTAADIDGAVALCRNSGAPSVIGVSPMPKPPGFYGRVDPTGVYHKVEAQTGVTQTGETQTGEPQTSEPQTGEAVIINGAVYVGRPERLRLDRSFQSEGTRAWIMPPERGWDVDTLFDFVMAEALWPHVAAGRDLGGVRR